MTRHLLIAKFAALALLPLPAAAQSQLDRLEAISEMSNDMMVEIMIREVAADAPDARETLLAAAPDGEWDAEMRDAGSCMLESYAEQIGSDGVDDMLDALTTYLEEASVMSMEDLADASPDLPEGITEEDNMRIAEDCGMIDLQIARMQESGFMDAVMAAAMSAGN